jgi:hypothetical protein
VTVTPSGTGNYLTVLAFYISGQYPGNGLVDAPAQGGAPALTNAAPAFDVDLSSGHPSSYTFTVRRAGAGAVTLPITVEDGCGIGALWSTFVGFGPTGP